MTEFISADVLRKIVPLLSSERAALIAALCNEICPRYKLATPDAFHEFIATLAVESNSFFARAENLNYSAAGLLMYFPKYFNPKQAAEYERKPEAIANHVYANRMGNGPEASGDGWKYRGAGFIQATGKDMHKAYARYINLPLDDAANLMRTNDRHALNSACWIFAVVKGLVDEAIDDKFETITIRINGGKNGYPERLNFLARAKKYLPA